MYLPTIDYRFCLGQINTYIQAFNGDVEPYGPPWTPGIVGRRVGIGTRWEGNLDGRLLHACWRNLMRFLFGDRTEIAFFLYTCVHLAYTQVYAKCKFFGKKFTPGIHLGVRQV